MQAKKIAAIPVLALMILATPVSALEMYTTAGVHIRAGAGTNTTITGSVPAGTPVDVAWTKDSWARLGDGNYVCSAYLTSDKKKAGSRLVSQKTSTYLETDEGGIIISYADYNEADRLIKKNRVVDYMITSKGNHYYAVEAGSKYGKIVQGLKPGMIINIDGVPIVIDGEVTADYNEDDPLDVWKEIGYADCIQTCTPPYGGPVVIKYGHKTK